MDSHAECSKHASAPRSKSNGGAGVKRTTVQHQQLPPRPKLTPAYPSATERTPPRNSQAEEASLPFALAGLAATQDGEATDGWVSVITAPAYAPLRCWRSVMQSLIRHPERNSSNILRADILADTSAAESAEEDASGGWKKQWTVRRALLPRRPNLDWRMEQDCSLYYRYRAKGTASNQHDADDQAHGDGDHDDDNVEEALVVYTPLVGVESHPKMAIPTIQAAAIGAPPPHEAYVPFYHPKVRALAFHFRRNPTSDDSDAPIHGELGISLVPFSSASDAESDGQFGPTHRLSRVGLSLLTTLHMHTWGELHSYQKRVHHDQIVARTLYQDTYLELKSRYASHLIATWAEATDPTKHVFEEMGIAAFLIALWRQLYASEQPSDGNEEWKGKVKFVDVGCGNGLLTYILSREGFKGVGLDLRARKSWTQYRNDGAELHEWTFNPADLVGESAASDVWQGAFLIGNHADELTPWLPVLATHYGCRGFINLPCCYFSLDGTRDFPLLLRGVVPRNEQYLAYVSHVHRQFGWHVELEPLRIPSTKNWCFVGRTRTPLDPNSPDADVFQERLNLAIQQALASGWAPRSSQA